MATNTRALWADDVPDLTDRLHEVPNCLNLAQVSDAVGLSPNTIMDALSRPPITHPTNPLGPLSRPARRVGNTPLWLPEQVAEAKARQRANGHRHLGGGDHPLPLLDPEVVAARRLVSTTQIASMAHMRTGPNKSWKPVHEQTVRRWSRDEGNFPVAVALRARDPGYPGVPIVVYELEDVLAYLRNREGVHVVMDGLEFVVN